MVGSYCLVQSEYIGYVGSSVDAWQHDKSVVFLRMGRWSDSKSVPIVGT